MVIVAKDVGSHSRGSKPEILIEEEYKGCRRNN